ncbi:MAG TPA: cache domain-containing protein, partial [Anaerovoracaceae bacterium]|nr:cache domain-containing protein [Anaerovoracaceae bacterium]
MNRLNLKQKYFFSITLVCLISLLIVSAVSYYSSYQLVLSSTKSKLEMASERYSNEIDSWFLSQKNDLNAIQEDVEINSAYYSDDALLSRMLNYKLKKTQNRILDYYIGFSDKRLLSGTGWQPYANYDCTKRDWYQQAINKGDTVFTAPYVDSDSKQIVITISEPLIMNGKVVGVIAVDITVDYLVQLVNNIKIFDGSYAFLVDSQKNIVTYPIHEFLPTGEKSYQLDEVMKGRFNSLSEQIDSGKYQLTKLNDYDGQEKYFYLSEIDSAKWILGFSIPTTEVTNNLHNLLIGFAIAGALSIGISMIVIFALINGLLQPVLRLITIVKQFGEKNMDARSEITSTDEIGELGRTFNNMADTIQNYSLTLENKVIERTKELNEKNVELQDSIGYREKAEKDLLYMSYHDCLTEIYNRRFYEEELKRLDTKRNLPLTIVMGDVNGLKLINDSFGHAMGDELLKKVAKVIK